MKLMPASRAVSMIATHSSWSRLPNAPNIIAPRQRVLTSTPVPPSLRNFTVGLPSVASAHIRPGWADMRETLSGRSADRTLHLQLDQPTPLDRVLHRQCAGDRLDEPVDDHPHG